MSRKDLKQLYAEHTGKSSDKWSLYLSEYDRLFDDYQDKTVRLFEIGVQNGGSLEIWAKYFSRASILIGCDINPDCARLAYEDKRICVIVGDVNASETCERILERCSEFDIVIDDGSHLSSDIIKSFALYFPRLADGGLFVVEDLHCGYWGGYEGGLFDPYSSISFFKRLADVTNHEHWGVPKRRADILSGILTKYGCELDEESLTQVHSIEFINSLCVVRKASATHNCLGRHVVAGSLELVVSGNLELDGLLYQLNPIFDQSSNPWSTRATPPDEALVDVEGALADTKQALADAQRALGYAQNQLLTLGQQVVQLGNDIAALRDSLSWRITSPFRFVISASKNFAGSFERSRDKSASGSTAVPEVRLPKEMQKTMSTLRNTLLRRGHVFYLRYLKETWLGRLIGQVVLKTGLVSSTDLQFLALQQSSPAIDETRPADAMAVTEEEAASGVAGFHASLPLNLHALDALAVRPSINVLLPSLRLKHMSGGPNTALMLAALLAEKGECLRLIACDASVEGEEAELFPHMDALLQRPVVRERIQLVDAFDRTKSHAIGAKDLFLATAWWTAQTAKYAAAKTIYKTFIYLIQDFEPILHEGSSFQARALETYGMPHIPVINTQLLLDHLVAEKVGRYADPVFCEKALRFEPALDRSYYYPDPGESSPLRKKTLLFYARPTFARRNLFEIGVVALRQAVASGAIDRDNWNIWAMGENFPPVPLGNGVVLKPLPWMSYDDYAKRVRTSDLLLSLMLSPHPSYPPLEMAASGKLVVTSSFSVKSPERMKAFSPNIIAAEPTAESVAAAIESAAGRINAGLPSYDPSGAMALPSNWDESMREIVPMLLQRIYALRTAPPESELQKVPGLPLLPMTEYESYRKSRLEGRRREGGYRQESGLLSFVTSAYNTDPAFLEELGGSVFLQDGGMHFEWLILDNGSTRDDTRHTLQSLGRHPGVRLERVEQNLGIIGGLRYLLERAQGRYILPLDSDDLIERDCVHVLTRFIKEHDYPALLYTDEDKLVAGRFGMPYFKPDWDPVLFVHSCYIAHLCAINRKKALELGLYSDKGAEGCHDWDSFIRFMNAGHVPLHVPEVLYSWRVHEGSTSGNIASKSYITDSHRHTLQRFLTHVGVPEIDLVDSPLFAYNVDWWFRRRRVNPRSLRTILIGSDEGSMGSAGDGEEMPPPLAINPGSGVKELAALLQQIDSELIHFCWQDTVPDDDEWRWDATALLELFADAVMVGGTLHDGTNVLNSPCVFGFGKGYDCPDRGRPLNDPGYFASMWKARSVSSISSGHFVVRRDFLQHTIATLLTEKVYLNMLGPWLSALAVEAGKRVVFSPFMRAKAAIVPEDLASESARAAFLSRFWSHFPEVRFYSSCLGLTPDTAYVPVFDAERDRQLGNLQWRTQPYPDWLGSELRRRAARYPVPAQGVGVSFVTPVYHGSNLDLLDLLASAISAQSMPPFEWLVVANGPMSQSSVDLIRSKAAGEWRARLIEEPKPIGIVASLRLGLEEAQGEYVVPIDADDLLTPDAVQILAHEIIRLGRPDLVYTDEDLLIDGRSASPYLRAEFDPVLSLDNSTIWHLMAMKRDAALSADVYGDPGANWCQDWDVVSRIFGSGGRICHVPEVLYHWRQHPGSTTNNAQGDPRSLDSVRHILERHIARSSTPHHFCVAEWPEHRGARELYIARRPDDLPQFVWMGDVISEEDLRCNETAILVFTGSGVVIDSRQVFVEAARLFELHPYVGVVGGLVEGPDGKIVDGCYMVNHACSLESPWLGQKVTYCGPYALALKTQTVATTGNSLAFFRVAALKEMDIWPLGTSMPTSDLVMQLCGRLAANNWTVAFSPLVRARAGSSFRMGPRRIRPPAGVPLISHGLVRYGMSRSYRD